MHGSIYLVRHDFFNITLESTAWKCREKTNTEEEKNQCKENNQKKINLKNQRKALIIGVINWKQVADGQRN